MLKTIIASLFLLLASCDSVNSDLIDLASSAGEEETPTVTTTSYIVTSGQDSNHMGIAVYDISGNLITQTNFKNEFATPRGLWQYDDTRFLISLDTTDSVYLMDVQGDKTLFHGSAQFSGSIFDGVTSNDGITFVIESNRIEAFDDNGVRITNYYINTTVGGCTLSNPRGMIINSSGQLVVTNQGGSDQILTYDISSAPVTCVSAVNFGNNPWGLIENNGGGLYITTQGDDRIYSADADGSNASVIWDTDTSVINNPTGIAILPSGNLIVASSANDRIEQITPSGTRVGTVPFINDSNSLNIADILIFEVTE